jgi:hypothetical protein
VKSVNKDVLKLCEDVGSFFLLLEATRFPEGELKSFLMGQYGFDPRLISPRIAYLKGSKILKEVSKKGGIVELDVGLLLDLLEGSEVRDSVRALVAKHERVLAESRLLALREAEKEASE